jgi:hypothetical protein
MLGRLRTVNSCSSQNIFERTAWNLKLDFGDGLIRQSEFRTVGGGNASYTQRIKTKMLFTAGLDFRRDSPQNAELAHADASGVFHPSREMTSTISDLAPYASVKGSILRFFTYSLGVRQDEV